MPLKAVVDNSSEGSPVVGIIGGGPAGMSCALWLKQLGLSPLIIECNAGLGGQLSNINRINRWVLGLPGKTSAELARQYGQHIDTEQVPVHYNTRLTAIEALASGYRLMLQPADEANERIMPVRALVIATGVQALGHQALSHTPGFDPLYAAGLIGCFPTGHLDQLELLRGKTVAVIGGGDNAHFTVNDVAAVAARTYLLIRSRPKAQQAIRRQVQALIGQGLVIEYPDSEAGAFRQDRRGIEISLKQSGSTANKIHVDRVFMRIGFAPNSQFLESLGPLAGIGKQAHGYLNTDSRKRTSIASVYAIGDVANPDLQSVVTAIAEGAIAARTIADDISIEGTA